MRRRQSRTPRSGQEVRRRDCRRGREPGSLRWRVRRIGWPIGLQRRPRPVPVLRGLDRPRK
jgi:hypothetical protein